MATLLPKWLFHGKQLKLQNVVEHFRGEGGEGAGGVQLATVTALKRGDDVVLTTTTGSEKRGFFRAGRAVRWESCRASEIVPIST